MNDTPRVLRSALAWGIPFAVVLAALGYETDWGRDVASDPPEATAVTPQPAAVALLPEYRIEGGVEARKETVDRVLFNPTRRPAPPATQSAGAGAMPKGQYTLTGTTVAGTVATAFLREVKGGKSRSVHKGDTLNGMLVADVKPDHVRLKQGDEVEDLQLKIALGPKETIQSVAPVVPVAAAQREAQAAAAANRERAARQALLPGAVPPAAAPRAGGSASVAELLAERRRAARAAADAAAGGAQQQQSQTTQRARPR